MAGEGPADFGRCGPGDLFIRSTRESRSDVPTSHADQTSTGRARHQVKAMQYSVDDETHARPTFGALRAILGQRITPQGRHASGARYDRGLRAMPMVDVPKRRKWSFAERLPVLCASHRSLSRTASIGGLGVSLDGPAYLVLRVETILLYRPAAKDAAERQGHLPQLAVLVYEHPAIVLLIDQQETAEGGEPRQAQPGRQLRRR